jgi:hypothetical protein
MTEENTNQDTNNDDFSDIDEQLKELGIDLDDDGTPTSLASGAEDEETIKKRKHAYAVLKRKAKEEKAAREKMEAELNTLKEKNNTGTPQPPTSGGGSTATQIMQRLKIMAMQELGITEVTTAEEMELINAHTMVLYQRLLQHQQATVEATGKADAFVTQELQNYNLEDEDRTEVTKRVKGLSPLDQTNPQMVREVVAKFMGEKVLSGHVPTGSPANAGSDDSGTDTSSARAAGSAVSRTGRGVKLGGAKKSSDEVKPPTPDEQAQMKMLGITDVKMYREAKLRSAQYKD